MKRSHITLCMTFILSFTFVFTSCNGYLYDDDETKSARTPEQEKQLIIESIGSLDISQLYQDTSDKIQSTLLGNIGSDSSTAEAEMDIFGTVNSEPIQVYGGIKDNLIKLEMLDESVYIAMTESGSVSFIENNGAYQIDVMTLSVFDLGYSNQTTVGDGDALSEMLNVFENFKLPPISAEQLSKEGDFYIISDSYYTSLAQSITNMLIDYAIASGNPSSIISDAQKQQITDSLEQAMTFTGLKMGFGVGTNSINGFYLSMDFSSADLETDTSFGDFGLADDITVDFKLAFRLNDDATELEKLKIDALVSENSNESSVNVLLESLKRDGVTVGETLSLEINIANGEIATEYISTDDDEYDSIYIYGSTEVSMDILINYHDVSDSSSPLFKLDLTLDIIPTDALGIEYDCSEEAGESLPNFDISSYFRRSSVLIEANSADSSSYEITLKIDDKDISADIVGTVVVGESKGFGKFPSAVDDLISSDELDDLVQNFDSITYTAQYIEYSLYFMDEEKLPALWYDEENGLYVIFSSEETQYYISKPDKSAYSYILNCNAITDEITFSKVNKTEISSLTPCRCQRGYFWNLLFNICRQEPHNREALQCTYIRDVLFGWMYNIPLFCERTSPQLLLLQKAECTFPSVYQAYGKQARNTSPHLHTYPYQRPYTLGKAAALCSLFFQATQNHLQSPFS